MKLKFEYKGTNNMMKTLPRATFTYTINSPNVSFDSTGSNGDTYSWDFGDGGSSTDENPTHEYTATGDYTATLTITFGNNTQSTHSETFNVIIPIKDYDGNIYTEVVIGTQTWLIENLITTHFDDGTEIKNSITNTIAEYQVYDNNMTNKDKYGFLYNIHIRDKVIINGYHVPTKSEYETLAAYISSAYDLRTTGTTYWNNSNGLDTYGFDLRGGGRMYTSSGNKTYQYIREQAHLYNSDDGYVWLKSGENFLRYVATTSDTFYLSVRLIKD
jgi:uncharacterized protein (TIGR02145 family)